MEEMTVLKRIVLLVTILLDLFLFVIGIEALTPFFIHTKLYLVLFPLAGSIVCLLVSVVGIVLAFFYLKDRIRLKLYLIIHLIILLINILIPIACML